MVRGWRGARRILVVSGLATCLTAGALAMAAEDDRAATETILEEIKTSTRKDVAGELVTRSRAALDRAARLRAGGDESHAKLADRLARTWAEAARDVVRAATVEESAAAARLGATDAGTLADRERALLEEAIAQSGRLRAQLEAVERDGKDQPARTSAAAADAGAKTPSKPPAPSTTDGGAAAPKPGAGGAR